VTRLLKVEATGNDFVLGIGDWARRLADDAELVIRLCDRRRGIGADGALALRVDGPDAVTVVHRNADGSRSDFCANGTRCAARAAVELLDLPDRLTVVTGWARIPAEVGGAAVILELPAPTRPTDVTLASAGRNLRGRRISVGVPHLVVPVTGLAEIDLDGVARPLRGHPDLGPEGANVHLVEHLSDGTLAIRSLERGVDTEVLCCGSGVVASALVTMAEAGLTTLTVVPLSGDPLLVEALDEPPCCPSRLTGPARLVAAIELLD